MKVEMQLGSEKLSIETGKVAKQADGAVWVQYGGTVVLVTVVADDSEHDLDFFPLTVDYRERGYATGRIPTVYGRREPRPGTSEQLIARLIDHCIRPLFPKDFKAEVQILCNVFSSDGIHPADVPALIGTSAALSISDIPFNGPVAAVTVGKIENELIINPSYEELHASEMELFVSGKADAVMSVEGSGHEIPEDEVIDTIVTAHAQIKEIIKLQEGLAAVCSNAKRDYAAKDIESDLSSRVRNLATSRIRESIGMADKKLREDYLEQVQEEVLSEILEDTPEETDPNAAKDTISILSEIEKEEMREAILTQGKRVDGRGVTDIRPISGEVALLPHTHGSALFTRGQTQALCVTTLGTSGDEDVQRGLDGEARHSFFLHYNFPPFSTGEVKRMMGPGRREIGHGALAQKALEPVIPEKEDFHYTIRVVSEILESNASSSMASVCGATLALLDAGVPLKRAVAGIGVGLIKEGEQEAILTDMLGTEDFLGDMDFKVAGTSEGVTAIQMDIKIDGVSPELMRRAIHQAKEARLAVIDQMNAVIAEPRAELSPYAPRIHSLQIAQQKIKDLIGPRGKTVQGIQEETNTTINIEDDGTVEIAATSAEDVKRAEEKVLAITAMPEIGKEYTGKVVRTAPFGAFVEILPGKDGLVHISQMGDGYVRRAEDVMQVGDEVTVRILTIDEQDRVDLTLVAVGGVPVEELNIESNDEREFSTDREGSRDYRDTGRSGYRDNRGDSRDRRGNDTRERRNNRYDQRDNTRDFRNRRSPRIPKGRPR
ncbi:MAG: polyribonucleotide nucleotidyltransferase [Candidatus Poribacteria bacterium]|nr:polyribonucleotide nucleotidyltransferase [Candidatus Poribacteria bacterium]MYK17265.1 polyribonucleotide nucleotidyltransferase [Candidatus Poribacteria bacterium]